MLGVRARVMLGRGTGQTKGKYENSSGMSREPNRAGLEHGQETFFQASLLIIPSKPRASTFC